MADDTNLDTSLVIKYLEPWELIKMSLLRQANLATPNPCRHPQPFHLRNLGVCGLRYLSLKHKDQVIKYDTHLASEKF